MFRKTGDLVPFASGSASLGVDQIDGQGGFSTEIRPYAHMHMNSGVFHGHRGASGVIRYNNGQLEKSDDGGITFTSFAAGASDPHSQQAAYDGGNEIITSLQGESYQGVVVVEPSTPFDATFGWDDTLDPYAGHTNYGIAVSGAPVPDSPSNSSLSRLTSSFLHFRPSGTDERGARIGYEGVDSSTFQIATSGNLELDISGGITNLVEGSVVHTIVGSNQINTDGFQFNISETNISHQANNDIGLTAILGDVQLNPFSGSGQLRYRFGPYQSFYIKTSDSSTSGPFADGFNPLVPSGAIVQMILENVGGGSVNDLQDAYDGGNEIDINTVNGQFDGVVIKENLPLSNRLHPTTFDGRNDNQFSIAVSGFTLTPNEKTNSYLTRIASNGILIRGSGLQINENDSPELFLGFINPTNSADTSPIIYGSGQAATQLLTEKGFIHTCKGTYLLNADGGGTLAFNGSTTFESTVGNIDICADVQLNLDTTFGDVLSRANQNMKLDTFNGSGSLTYRFGPHQSWYIRTTDSSTSGPFADGFNPLVASGAIVQMILENATGDGQLDTLEVDTTFTDASSVEFTDADGIAIDVIDIETISFAVTSNGVNGIDTSYLARTTTIDAAALSGLVTLQGAYNGGSTLYTIDGTGPSDNQESRDHDLGITAVSGKFNISTNGQLPHVSLSGILFPPSGGFNEAGDLTYANLSSPGLGDITMHTHTLVDHDIRVVNPLVINEEVQVAQSIGLGTLALNTGSGVVNISIGSGIAQFFNTGTQGITTSPTAIIFSNGGNTFKDSHFVRVGVVPFDPIGAGIRFMIPGCYQVTYSASCIKTGSGITTQTITSKCQRNAVDIFGSTSYSYYFDSTNGRNTGNATFMMDASANDHLALMLEANFDDVDNVLTTIARALNVNVTYIGPKRGTVTV